MTWRGGYLSHTVIIDKWRDGKKHGKILKKERKEEGIRKFARMNTRAGVVSR